MSKRTRTESGFAMALVVALVVPMLTLASPAAAETIADCNVNADAFDDLAVGVPREDAQGIDSLGAVHEFISTADGLVADSTWSAINEPGQRSGESLICADFNGDGFSDLVIGDPYKDLGNRQNTGRITVIYGGPTGLSTDPIPPQSIDQNARGLRDRAEVGDVFGFDMTWCNFDNDPYADLAVGVPGEDVAGQRNAGAVHVIFGGPNGLTRRDVVIHQNRPGMADRAEANDFFGEFITAADIDSDGGCDLVVGIPSEDVGTKVDAGAIQVIFGGPNGLTRRNQIIHRDTRRVNGRATAGERFGAPLFFGDFFANQQGRNIIVGVPGQDVRGRQDAGAVHILGSGPGGLTGRGDLIIHQNSRGIRGRAQANDQFGRSVIAGFFNGDSFLDLAVGVPGERVRRQANAGQVQVIFGTSRGLGRKNRVVASRTLGLEPQRGLFFGATLARGDFNGDSRDDLAIGAPFADWVRRGRTIPDAGLVGVVLGSIPGLRGQGSQILSQEMFDIDDGISGVQACDNFGNFNPGLAIPPPPGVVNPRCSGGRSLDGSVLGPLRGVAPQRDHAPSTGLALGDAGAATPQ